MDTLISYLSELIRIPSVTNEELGALTFLEDSLKPLGFNIERLPISDTRYNLFFSLGTPKIVYTTHCDVVPALKEQFEPQIKEGRVYGRGACDAKGALSCMIFCLKKLIQEGESNLGLLVVVGEEVDGIGAIEAAKVLKNRGIQYIINGEPTEGQLASGHKGGVCFRIELGGKSCHSGYPELGDDANLKLVKLCTQLYAENWGQDPVLGEGSINIGEIHGGNANNIVSNKSNIQGMIRTVTDNEVVINQLKTVCSEQGANLEIFYNAPSVTLTTISGFPTVIAKYCTDVPQLLPIGAKFLMYGPGSITHAHTVDESIAISELEQGVTDYYEIYYKLKTIP